MTFVGYIPATVQTIRKGLVRSLGMTLGRQKVRSINLFHATLMKTKKITRNLFQKVTGFVGSSVRIFSPAKLQEGAFASLQSRPAKLRAPCYASLHAASSHIDGLDL